MFNINKAIPKGKPQISAGYANVLISNVSEPVVKNIRGEDKMCTTVTFKDVNSKAEIQLDCICFLNENSRLFQIFKAIYTSFSLSDKIKYRLNDLIGKELKIFVEEIQKGYKTYRKVTMFLPFDADVKEN